MPALKKGWRGVVEFFDTLGSASLSTLPFYSFTIIVQIIMGRAIIVDNTGG